MLEMEKDLEATSAPPSEFQQSQEFNDKPEEVINEEVRARIEKNRKDARAKLLAKYQSNQEIQGSPVQRPPKKRKRTEEEIRQQEELRNVVSTGQVVRVHGTKLIDTGGGFLLEESDLQEQTEAEKIIVPETASLIPSDCVKCLICGKEFSHSFLLVNYDENICDQCRDPDGIHSFITRTDAKQEFLLKDVDFDKREPVLKYLTRPNPHNSHWGDMKLYLRIQVERRAKEVWGTLEEISKHREKREETRVESKMKKYNKKMKSLRMSARSSLYTRDLSSHQHNWDNEVYNEEDDNYTHTCDECGQSETFEKL